MILHEAGPVGHLLKEMEAAMIHRGPDSTGFALYGPPPRDDRIIVRARFAEAPRVEETTRGVVDSVIGLGGELVGEPEIDDTSDARDRFCRLAVRFGGSPAVLLESIERVEGVYVHSMGRRLEIIKDVGDAHIVAARHDIDEFVGTHGLAHSRLATESIVDVEYSHPFWARPFLDVAVAHNGQLTNYFKMRRLMVQRGLRFLTSNDSELIAVHVADQMAKGASLKEALTNSIGLLDGVFTYLLSTDQAIGCATDRLAIKPIVITELERMTAMATEEQALHRIVHEEIETFFPREGTSTVWSVKTLKRAA